jgi:hypothetical protein
VPGGALVDGAGAAAAGLGQGVVLGDVRRDVEKRLPWVHMFKWEHCRASRP